ncbi:uncharacterized protein TNCT_217211 [Trichonephila clavata]|uniref:Uncharacterized protein n=1 Tax=Trichonephila clavata TaxID=2740835 RepID=A0A8X6LUF3_TRICU|nr:uncharacterized protein TNCT_217211 [Trichonephila clavata]
MSNMKDPRSGLKKELKALGAPFVSSESDIFDSVIDTDDDLVCISSCDPEVQAGVSHNDMLQEVKPESNTEPEIEITRRPSRRAARVAAKKISNHVRSYGVNDDDLTDFAATSSSSLKSVSSSHPYSRPKQKKVAQVEPELEMECCDEFLSPIQAEFLLKAQLQYNTTMKSLRQLMSTSVRVFQTEPDGSIVPLTCAPDISLKTGFVSSNAKLPTAMPTAGGNRPNRSNPTAALSVRPSNAPSQVASIFIT